MQPRFALGSQATLRGHQFTVLGHIQRQITTGDGGHWDSTCCGPAMPMSIPRSITFVDSGGHFTSSSRFPYGEIGGGERHRYVRGYFCSLAEQKTESRVVHINASSAGPSVWAGTVEVKTSPAMAC